MKNNSFVFFLFLILGTIFLSISFYNNNFHVVEPEHYRTWSRVYERVVVGRLAKSQQDGIFSAGGLLGLANAPDGWTFDPDFQYTIYENGLPVENYLVYKSHPGIQGILFSLIDLITDLSPAQTIIVMRLTITVLSALTLALFCAWLAVEFGWLSAVFVLLFSAASEWMILPASNAYWNLWAFYVPFVTGILLLRQSAHEDSYNAKKIYSVLFLAMLIKVYFTGFEMITAALVMSTIPFIYHAIAQKWKFSLFVTRVSILSTVLITATLAGLGTLALQISINDQSPKSAYRYIERTFNRRAIGDPDEYKDPVMAESMRAPLASVIQTYLNINAFNTKTSPRFWQVPYWKLIVTFGIFTLLFIVKYRIGKKTSPPQHGIALAASAWLSIAAPLSWYIIFKPTSYIHTFLFPMAWQMPFVLLGFALCGYVIQDFIRRRN